MKKSIIKFIPMAVLAATFTSCDEDAPGGATGAAEQKIAGYIIETEAIASSVYNAIDKVQRDTVLMDGDTIPFLGAIAYMNGNVTTVDYGTGTVGADGVTRKGSIAVTESGDYFASGGLLSCSFNGFSVDDNTIGGSIAVTNLGNDTLSMDISSMDYNNLLTYNASKKVHWISGFNTISDAMDDKFDLYGDANGSENGTNNTLTVDFTSPMRFDRSCQYTVVEGVLGLAFAGDSITTFDTGSVDFISSDGCNNSLILTVSKTGGTSITLPRNFNGF